MILQVLSFGFCPIYFRPEREKVMKKSTLPKLLGYNKLKQQLESYITFGL